MENVELGLAPILRRPIIDFTQFEDLKAIDEIENDSVNLAETMQEIKWLFVLSVNK